MLTSRIIGTGSCAPAKVLTNHDLERMVDTTDTWVRTRTGIAARRVCGPGEDSATLAEGAAVQALAAAGVDSMDLDMLLVATITPAVPFPATACLVQDGLKARRAAAFDIGAGCSGFIYGLAVADSLIRTGSARTILLVGAESLSKFVNWNDRNTCVLFGDGAGAVVLQAQEGGPGIRSTHLYSDGAEWALLAAPGGGSRTPPSEQVLREGLHLIHMQSGTEVFRLAVRAMEEACIAALKANRLEASDVDFIIPHQANLRIIQTLANRLAVPEAKVILNLDRYGNTSAASIPLALDEAVRDGRVQPGMTLLLTAFGTGVTWASAVLTWCGDHGATSFGRGGAVRSDPRGDTGTTVVVEAKVKEIIGRQLGVKESQVKPEARLAEDLGLGTDSLDTVGLVMALEEEFGLQILDSETENVQTVQDAIQYIKDRTRRRAQRARSGSEPRE
jgi:3-oxoacyl-[acyl-carrier-protein] synthase III